MNSEKEVEGSILAVAEETQLGLLDGCRADTIWMSEERPTSYEAKTVAERLLRRHGVRAQWRNGGPKQRHHTVYREIIQPLSMTHQKKKGTNRTTPSGLILFSEADDRATNKEIPKVFRNPKFHQRLIIARHWFCEGQINSVHVLTPSLRHNLILSSHLSVGLPNTSN